MTDTAMCALIVQLWLDIRAAIHGPLTPGQIRWTRATLLAAPYVSLLAFSLLALSASASAGFVKFSSGRPLQTNFYCTLLENDTFLISQYTVLLFILIVTLIFDVCIIRILYRRWWFFQRTGENALGIPLSVAFRVIIFCAYRIVVAVAYVAIMLSVSGISTLRGPDQSGSYSIIPIWVDTLQAQTPLVASIIFGTNKEVLDTLIFWPRRFKPVDFYSLIIRRKRSPVTTQRVSNAHGEVFDDESVASRDSVLDIRQETKHTD
ncbi:hypothetical protein JB92DRAFT_2080679 [Gautieria morchelliformis]|nr:hypothetical protein JB92DRAFT_2080679 [Gautieria morchelliformis]